MRIAFAALTDVGLVRQNNEDTYLVVEVGGRAPIVPPPSSGEGIAETNGHGFLCAVADGMGGALAGEVASRMAVDALTEAATGLVDIPGEDAARDHIFHAISTANSRIFEASQTNPQQRGMGTTLTVALIRNGRIQFFQVGDSKGFIFVRRSQTLHQMTKDHSLIGQLVDDKVISAEDAEQLQGGKNIILKALGAEASVEIAYSDSTLGEGDGVLLCSDGLHGCVRAKDLEELVASAVDTGKLCEDLVREAKDRGGPDNITVVSVTVLDAVGELPADGLLTRVGRWLKGRR